MAFAPHPAFRWLQERRTLTALAASLMLGGCGQTLGGSDLLAGGAAQGQPPQAQATALVPAGNELQKATQYWGDAFAKNPRDLKTALNYARNLKAMGEKRRALAVLQQASVFHGQSPELNGEYGRLALDFDQVNLANQLLAAADDPTRPDWRIVSARGTVLAKEGKYNDAIAFYERALTLAPTQPSLMSNLALAYAMNGDPGRAEAMLRQASTADSNSPRIRQNLALVLGLQGKYDEAKLLAARDLPIDKAADNAAYLKQVVRLDPKSVPNSNPAPDPAEWKTQAEIPVAAVPVHPVQKLAEATPQPAAPPVAERKTQAEPKPAAIPVQSVQKVAEAAPEHAAPLAETVAWTTAEAKPEPPAIDLVEVEPAKAADAAAAQWASQLTKVPAAKPAEKAAKPQPKTMSVAEMAKALGRPQEMPAAAPAKTGTASTATTTQDEGETLSWAPLAALSTKR